MKIAIAQRLRPYSHFPGACCPIPGTQSLIRAFPTRLAIDDLVLPLPFTGPVRDFTLQLDLERGCVWVFGHAPERRFKIKIKANSDGFSVDFGSKELFYPRPVIYEPIQRFERLSLGCHKAQDWDLVLRRFNLEEILPSLFALGQMTPEALPIPTGGAAQLLDCFDVSSLENFCRAAFKGLLVPRLEDDQFQGLCPEGSCEGNPFFLLTQGSRLIRSLFVEQKGEIVTLLPKVLFPSGRMTDVALEGIGTLHFEWLKNRLSRAVLLPSHKGTLDLRSNMPYRSCRVYRNKWKSGFSPSFAIAPKGKGAEKHFLDQPFSFQPGEIYYFDRFYT